MKSTERTPVLHFAILLSILALAAFLRYYCLTCSSLWHDEGNTWAVAQRSFEQIAIDAAADIHPPGYYWLLKLWGALFGFSAWGMRSLSALAGLLTVAVIYLVALEIGKGESLTSPSLFALLASLVAALNPFQIFYSQEARMYALLMLESATLMWALLAIKRRWTSAAAAGALWPYAALYLLAASAGLWTHYTFVVVLAAAGGAAVWWWPGWKEDLLRRNCVQHRQSPTRPQTAASWRPLLLLLALNGFALLSYLPWLPTGSRRLLNWPAQDGFVSLPEGLQLTLQSLATGSIRSGPEPAWGWLPLVGLIPIWGLWRLRRSGVGAALLLWIMLPVAVMFGFGLFSPSFLKFLLVLSPAWCIASAAAAQPLANRLPLARLLPWSRTGDGRPPALDNTLDNTLALLARWAPRAAAAGLALALALAALPNYYLDPAARDNYAGIARTVAALGDPSHDLVILNAPGQADVWRFYDVGVDMLPLPAERPPDRAKTEETLAREAANRHRIFAVLWATEQSDWDGIVENWLGRHAFKGLESWQGNVRFATYTVPRDLSCSPLDQPPRFETVADLVEICFNDEPLAAGDTLLVGLRWLPLQPPDRRLKVTVQLLDPRNQIVVQRDGEPGGGALPTLNWQTGQLVADNHGLPLPPGTPPGSYRLIVALYDADTGARLATQAGDSVEIAQPALGRPTRPLPVAIIPMNHLLQRQVGPLTLIGYDYYRKAFAHAPQTALAPGDLLQTTLYWQAPDPLPANWPTDLGFRLRLGQETVTAPLAGGVYPTAMWLAGELVRSSFEIRYDGSDPVLWLEVGDTRLRMGNVPLDGGR